MLRAEDVERLVVLSARISAMSWLNEPEHDVDLARATAERDRVVAALHLAEVGVRLVTFEGRYYLITGRRPPYVQRLEPHNLANGHNGGER